MKTMASRKVFTFLALMIIAAGCGKSVTMDPTEQTVIQNAPNQNSNRFASCPEGEKATWTFIQPQPNEKSSVDILFVVDTSESMSDKRARVAQSVSSFVNALPAQTDYRIAVMLAHGKTSSWSGKLYAAPGSATVLDSTKLSATQIQAQLTNSLKNVVDDPDDANGEAEMLSFQNSLSASRLSKIQQQGFYRKDAALSVIMITDENDICYPPQSYGYASFPDYVPAPTDIELNAYNSNCLDSSGNLKITPESTLAALQNMKPAGDFTLGGIVHTDPSKVPNASGSEEAIGHGIVELINDARAVATNDGMLIDITSSDFSSGLSKLGALTSSQLTLQTSFQLDAPLDPTSLDATVDGTPVANRFDPQTDLLSVAPSDAGGAGSVVKVTACRVPTQ